MAQRCSVTVSTARIVDTKKHVGGTNSAKPEVDYTSEYDSRLSKRRQTRIQQAGFDSLVISDVGIKPEGVSHY